MADDATQNSSAALFVVVRNARNQHSVWPDRDPIPQGWTECGFCGPRQDCLDHIDATWTDMQLMTASAHDALLSGVID